MITAVATTNIYQALDIFALFDGAFEQNLVLGLASLYQSHPNMIRTIVNATANLIAVRFVNDFV
jgi:hypothetical protein